MSCKFNDRELHTETQTKVRNLFLSCILNCGDHAFDTSVTKTARNEDSIDVTQCFFHIFRSYKFGIYPFDLDLGIVCNTGML